MDQTFSSWLQKRDPQLLENIMAEAWSDYIPFKSTKFDPKRRQFLKTAAATTMAGIAALNAPHDKINWQPPPNNAKQLIQAVNKKYAEILQKNNAIVTPNDIKFIKPSEVLQKGWGSEYENILSKAKEAQNIEKIKLGDQEIEIPTFNDDSVTNVKDIDKPIMVVLMDPQKFGQSPTVKGFQSTVFVNKKPERFVVIQDANDEATLRHELRHTLQTQTQDTMGDQDGNEFMQKYLMNKNELGVRFAELRMRYYQLTKKIVNDDQKDIIDMLRHLQNNKDSYSIDVQQIMPILNDVLKRNKVKEFFDFIKKNMPRYVLGPKSPTATAIS